MRWKNSSRSLLALSSPSSLAAQRTSRASLIDLKMGSGGRVVPFPPDLFMSSTSMTGSFDFEIILCNFLRDSPKLSLRCQIVNGTHSAVYNYTSTGWSFWSDSWTGLTLICHILPSCLLAQPVLPISHEPKQNLVENVSTQPNYPIRWTTLYILK